MGAQRMMRRWVGFAALIAVLVVAVALWQSRQPPAAAVAIVELRVPENLSEQLRDGQRLFAQHCATCHGVNGGGVLQVGPPLVHIIYEPDHHPDEAFHAAVELGVHAHHWEFGNMPRIPDISEPEVTRIIAFIRALQRENGIY